MKITFSLLPLLFLGHATSAVAAPQVNHLHSVTIVGDATVQVLAAAHGKPAPVVVRLPAAKVELQCRRDGFRPSSLVYGVPPLDNAAAFGRGKVQNWNPNKRGNASVTYAFPAFVAAERGGPKHEKLGWLLAAARQRCASGKGPLQHKLQLAVSGRCHKVKGFGGASTASIGAVRTVTARVQCSAASAAPAAPAPKPGRPSARRARPGG